MYNKNIRVLGSTPSQNILPFTNKDRNKIILYDSFNTEVRNALGTGLSMFNDTKKDASLYKTLDNDTKTNLEKSDFNLAANIIDKSVKPLDSNTMVGIVEDRFKKDTNTLIDDVGNYWNKIKNNLNDIVNYPLILGGLVVLILLLKK